ncbi:hypothetical protein HYU06_05395 [Candidatus Woesearchaeota archaeon]|nr:hypothetical protein [Candidatus Woesearchaeota archaeon]
MTDEIKPIYEKLRKKHTVLPDYQKLNNEFEISNIDYPNFLLREIRHKICDKIVDFAKIFEELITAESFVNMHELKAFFSDDKKKIFDLFRELMKINRESLLLRLTEDDRTNAKFIEDALQRWLQLKKEILPVLQRLESAWDNDIDITQKLTYFG